MSTQPSASDDDEGITKISKNGDVILVVGLEKEKIQVASDFLEHISPVFKAMLNAPMKEGEALRNRAHDSPVTIELPGDCPKAMKHVLRTLYGADDHFESDPSFQTVYDMVTLADKYGMAGRLKLFGANWLRTRTGDEDFHGYDGYWDKFVIACILDDDHAFFQISSILHNVHGEIIEWSLRLPDRELGMRLVCMS
ncbi:hypothetical protein LB507_006851 [Fusarium sp. FIESC RH6]|nr:hypothetical protein LB507_006851 [Fusarium sp. FIESC RH6]